MPTVQRPLLVIVSAPSGAGKSTLCARLLAACPEMTYSVSCTTRAPRGDERDGADYFFLSNEVFERYAREDRFLEYAVVHGFRYGTLTATVRTAMESGRHVLLDIDVQGADQIRRRLAEFADDDLLNAGFLDIFIVPPSMEVLRERLVARGEDAPETIERRLANAEQEMARAPEYRYTVVNDDLDAAAARMLEIVTRESERL
jgi:guanylate kinase